MYEIIKLKPSTQFQTSLTNCTPIFAAMKLNTVIFDMDGLLIDSEPLWKEAAEKLFKEYNFQLTASQYAQTTGLRTKEFLQFWFTQFNIPPEKIAVAEQVIVDQVIELVKQKGKAMPGLQYIFDFFISRNFKVGLASSSPLQLIDIVLNLLNIRDAVQAVSSAAELNFGKPHPEVYLNCAALLGASPNQCICFEDSFNGMIAAKAARMKCVLVPANSELKSNKWDAADLKISTLANFNELLLSGL